MRRYLSTGFTLIELLVVMAIVGLLLSMAAPRYFGSLERAKEATLQENLKTVRDVIDKFYSDKGRYPETLDELVTAKYLKAIPVDPITDSSSTWIMVPPKNPSDRGVMDIKSGASSTTASGVPFGQL
ncbi:MAG TPA: prepilin-type N-terminal cleavage/methylation domain-containing protein [Nitrospira sp.]|nr:prepilin-type N-terminal cleavage/methylation domain-containing protein [Nitrospira sp.]